MKAKDAVRKPPVAIAAGASMAEAARLMDRRSVGALVVLDGERLVGIITDRDLVRRGLARRLPADARIDMVMTPDPVTVPADADVRQAISIFHRQPFRRLPLVEDGRIVGLLSVDNLVLDLVNDLDSLVQPVVDRVSLGRPEPDVGVLPYALACSRNGQRQEVGA